jgi:hypothetical protein
MRKIERNIDKYGLSGLNEEIRRQRQQGASLRDLAAYINQRILETVLRDVNESIVGDVESIYETLRGDEVSVGRRAELSSRLTRHGVPMEEIEDDFVSHQTVSTYLSDCLEMETSRQQQITTEEAITTIEWAEARGTAVIDRTLTRLHEADKITTAVDDVSCSHLVTCAECGTAYRLYEFIDQGGCDCIDDATDEPEETSNPS